MADTNIILTGMPASGKSTAGVILAKMLGMDFMDTDILIQNRDGRRLSEIIAEDGLDGFLRIEEEVCLTLHPDNTVIATGGSVCYSAAAMEHFKQLGTVVFLSLEFKDMQARLDNIKNRGVVLHPGQTIQDMFDERTPLYVQYANAIIQESHAGVENTVREVIELLH